MREQFAETKHQFLSGVPSRSTKPERMIAAILTKLGYRFRQNVRSLPGSPDFVIRGRRKIIFVHGCFWHRHGCRKSTTPKTNTDFWIRKFASNVTRDRRVVSELRMRKWSVLILWECKLADGKSLFRVLLRFLYKPALPFNSKRRWACSKAHSSD